MRCIVLAFILSSFAALAGDMYIMCNKIGSTHLDIDMCTNTSEVVLHDTIYDFSNHVGLDLDYTVSSGQFIVTKVDLTNGQIISSKEVKLNSDQPVKISANYECIHAD